MIPANSPVVTTKRIPAPRGIVTPGLCGVIDRVAYSTTSGAEMYVVTTARGALVLSRDEFEVVK